MLRISSKKLYRKLISIQINNRRLVPKDAYCMLSVTMEDLYPRESWNFVFGLANFSSRTGVFSFVRYDPVF